VSIIESFKIQEKHLKIKLALYVPPIMQHDSIGFIMRERKEYQNILMNKSQPHILYESFNTMLSNGRALQA